MYNFSNSLHVCPNFSLNEFPDNIFTICKSKTESSWHELMTIHQQFAYDSVILVLYPFSFGSCNVLAKRSR